MVNNNNQQNLYQRSVTLILVTLTMLATSLVAFALDTTTFSAQSLPADTVAQTYTFNPTYSTDLATLTAKDKKQLRDTIGLVKASTIISVEIAGHTDSSVIRARSKGIYADNYVLSRRRAENVASYLKQILKLNDAQLRVLGRGADVPLASNATAKGRAQNRRVEVIIRSKAPAVKQPEPIPEPAPIVKPDTTPTDGLTIQNVVKKVLLSNPDILIQVNERRSRNEEVERAKSGYLPTLDLAAGIGYEQSRNSSTRANGNGDNSIDLTRQESSINARQMLFDGYATKSEVERQQARVSSIAYTVQGVASNTALDAAEAFLNLLRNDKLLQLAEENLAAHKRTYDQIKIRSDAGVGRRADLEQISGRLALAKSNRIAAQSNSDDALTTFIRVTGEAPTAPLVRPGKTFEAMPINREDAIQRAIDKHPTLKSAIADVEATLAQQRAANTSFLPRFDLELSQSWNNNLDGQVGTNNDAQAMIRMRYNLLNGGGDAARKRQTAHLVDEAKEVRNRTYRQVIETMRLSWNAYQATELQLEYLKQHVNATTRTRDAYQKQFDIGQRTLLDLLNAENELFQAKQSYVGAEYDNLFSRYRILNAEGTLLQNLQITLPAEALVNKQ